MLRAILAITGGLALLAWSADRFVDGAAATAHHAGIPPLLIGMVVVGFGTSTPEMIVSALAAAQGNPGIALGNAYGSNITNIALILGITALINPLLVHSDILRRELPVLTAVTLLAGYQLLDGELTRRDAVVLIVVFFGLMGSSIVQGLRARGDALGSEVATELAAHPMPLSKALMWVVLGLALLIVGSRALVWGAVTIAHAVGVSDLIIGLTVVAIGTSLPELASSMAAARKGEHDLALGNILGSNLFNTLAVVGIAASIHPFTVEPLVLQRDWPVMTGLTLSLFIMGYGFRRRQDRIDRFDGGLLLTAWLAYTGWLIVYTLRTLQVG